MRFSRLAPDDKTVELLLLRQQLLIVRHHQKRGPTITRTEKLLPWHREVVKRRDWLGGVLRNYYRAA